MGMFYRVFVFLGPRPPVCRSSAPRSPGSVKFVSAVFDFLPVCIVKRSRVALVKYNFEFSIHKY